MIFPFCEASKTCNYEALTHHDCTICKLSRLYCLDNNVQYCNNNILNGNDNDNDKLTMTIMIMIITIHCY